MTASDRRTMIAVICCVAATLLIAGLVAVGYTSGRADSRVQVRHVQTEVDRLKWEVKVLDEEVAGLRNQQGRINQDLQDLME